MDTDLGTAFPLNQILILTIRAETELQTYSQRVQAASASSCGKQLTHTHTQSRHIHVTAFPFLYQQVLTLMLFFSWLAARFDRQLKPCVSFCRCTVCARHPCIRQNNSRKISVSPQRLAFSSAHINQFTSTSSKELVSVNCQQTLERTIAHRNVLCLARAGWSDNVGTGLSRLFYQHRVAGTIFHCHH